MKIGLNEAIVLQQLHYWLRDTNSGMECDGVRWKMCIRDSCRVKAWRDIARLLSFPENIDQYLPENLSHSVMSSGLVLFQY